jgi:dolichol-phosphate mannosyltransferase
MEAAGVAFELIVVDDGSTDDTLKRLHELAADASWLVVLHRDRAMGQSAATHAGIQAARGQWVAMLDADLQNDPADLPHLLAAARDKGVDLVQGIRASRADSGVRKFSTWVGRTTRKLLLGDDIIDTGCAARVLRIEYARQIPLYLKGMHRFIAQYAIMLGATVEQQPVNHRPRQAGTSKYGMSNRALVGLFDCLAVRWMRKRYRDPAAERATK